MPPRAITQVCPQCEMPLVVPASFAGQTVSCSRCGTGVLVSAPGETASPGRPGLPPHLQAGSPLFPPPPPAAIVLDVRPPHLREATATMPARDEPAADAGQNRESQPRSCLLSGCVTVVGSLALSAVVGLALAAVYLGRLNQQPSGGSGTEEDGGFSKRRYTDASRKAVTSGGVTVRIDKVVVGKVDYRSKGEILQTAQPHYLIVNINIKNKSREEPVKYLSWYDHQFEDDAGQRLDVELRDEQGERWEVFQVPGADQVERHGKSDADLPLDDDIIDSLVFKLPEERQDEPIPPLYLKLPGAAVGNVDDYRFHLPAVMVDRRDR